MSQASTNGAASITTTAEELEKLLSREVVKRATVPIENGVLCPKNFEGIQRLAQFMFASGMVPKGVETEAQCMMLVAAGTEAGLGLGQIAKGCMVVNMRPSIWGDVALGLCRRSVLCESIVETVEGDVATCTCRRKGEPAPIVRTFSVEEAKRAGLWGKSGPWSSYPKRMLQMRARAFALRDAFPDLLCGLSIAEEVMDYEPDGGREPSPPVAANGHTAASAIAALGQNTTLPQDLPPAAGPAAGDKTSDGAGSSRTTRSSASRPHARRPRRPSPSRPSLTTASAPRWRPRSAAAPPARRRARRAPRSTSSATRSARPSTTPRTSPTRGS